MRDSVKGLPEVQAENINYSPFVYQASDCISDVYRVGQA